MVRLQFIAMPTAPLDEDREQRISYEVIVDCYNDYEVTMGWYYYLQDRLDFPFKAEWFTAGKSRSEIVQVVGMADEEECKTDMLVEIKYRDGDLEDVFSAPLNEIEPLGDHTKREEAIGDWRYWLDHGGCLTDPDEYEDEEY